MSGGGNLVSPLSLLSRGLFDILFPQYCLICEQEGIVMCEACQLTLQPLYPVTCFGCQSPSQYGEICLDCQPRFSFDGVIISADYETDYISNLIKQCKYRFIKEYGEVMGWLVAEKMRKLLERSKTTTSFDPLFFQSLVTAIPLSTKRLRQREFNQADLIAQFFSRYFSLAYEPQLLQRRHRSPQASLSERKRQKNVYGSFFINNVPVSVPRLVLVVDDVITTGATLEEAARVLKEVGVEEVWGVMVAKG